MVECIPVMRIACGEDAVAVNRSASLNLNLNGRLLMMPHNGLFKDSHTFSQRSFTPQSFLSQLISDDTNFAYPPVTSNIF